MKNKIFIQPSDKLEQKLFLAFREKDAANMTVYFVVFASLQCAVPLFQLYRLPSYDGFLQVAPYMLLLFVRILLWASRERITKLIGYFYILVLIFQLAHQVFRTPADEINVAADVKEESRVKLLRIKYTLLTNATFFSGVLGAPNVHFLNTNVLMYLIAFVTLSNLNGGISDPLIAEYQFFLPANLSAIYIMWGLLQSRELMRFNEQQKTNQEKG